MPDWSQGAYLVNSLAWRNAFHDALTGSASAVVDGAEVSDIVKAAAQIANEAVRALHPAEGYPGDKA